VNYNVKCFVGSFVGIFIIYVAMNLEVRDLKQERKHKNEFLFYTNIINRNINDIKIKETIVPVKKIYALKYSKNNPYYALIQKYSKDNALHASMVAAIIQVESKFINESKSKKQAKGLMQIVLKTAAADAWKHLYGDNMPADSIMDSILYIPEENIKLGCAYLKVLRNYYYKVEDQDSRNYCMIAAYNTGAGNVMKAFVNEEDIRKEMSNYDSLPKYSQAKIRFDTMISRINSLTSDEVKDVLMNNLPYEETVAYLDNVVNIWNAYK
jgi:membrane-bound lytic murein transglycosylase C